MKRPTVLLINRVYPPGRGASGRVLRDLARGFARDGWHVNVLATGEASGKDRDGTIHITRVKAPDKPKHDILYVWIWLKLTIRALFLPRADLVVTLTDPPFIVLAGQAFARIYKARHIHWCHDLYPDLLPVMGIKLPGFVQRFLMRLSRRAMKSADKTIVIGRCMARHLNQSGIDAKMMTVIPNWPDIDLTRPSGHTTEFLENMQALKGFAGSKTHEEQLKHGPKFRVLYAGTLGRVHPYGTILDAAEILALDNPEIEFVFVGDGEGFNALAAERARRNLENVRLLPYQPNSALKDVMESGDVHIVSIKDEAAGMVVPCKLYSALAVGRPCIFIGPELCEIAKVISDFKAGVIVPQGDAEAFKEAVLQFRMSGEAWFSAHEGALRASEVFVPRDAMDAWISRARRIVSDDLGGHTGKTSGQQGYAPPKDTDYSDGMGSSHQMDDGAPDDRAAPVQETSRKAV